MCSGSLSPASSWGSFWLLASELTACQTPSPRPLERKCSLWSRHVVWALCSKWLGHCCWVSRPAIHVQLQESNNGTCSVVLCCVVCPVSGKNTGRGYSIPLCWGSYWVWELGSKEMLQRATSLFVFLAKYYSCDQIKKNEISWLWGTHGE